MFLGFNKEIINLMEYYAKYYIGNETKKATLSAYKNYESLHAMTDIFIDILHNYIQTSELTEDFKKEFYAEVFQIQKSYFSAMKDFKKHSLDSQKKKEMESLFEKVIATFMDKSSEIRIPKFQEYLDKQMKINTSFDLSNSHEKAIDNDKVPDEDNFNELLKLLILSNALLSKFTKYTEEKDMQSESLKPYAIGFNQFLSHLSLACYVDKNFETQKTKVYVQTNIYRSLRHLERAILDIYKIILIIVVKNNLVTKEEIPNLLEIRQFEINHISNSFLEKAQKYMNFIINIDFSKQNLDLTLLPFKEIIK